MLVENYSSGDAKPRWETGCGWEEGSPGMSGEPGGGTAEAGREAGWAGAGY